jgi:hypothetical protein
LPIVVWQRGVAKVSCPRYRHELTFWREETDQFNHGGPRLVYGVELTENTHAYLLGVDKHPSKVGSLLTLTRYGSK